MSLRNLPAINASRLPEICAFLPEEKAVTDWKAGIRSEQQTSNTISMLEVIGEDFWSGGGVTSKRISAALRSIGDQEVFVDLNSPGGDFFEGVAIYNMLREHKHKVTVRILGMAASAASVIAMAGDEILIGKAGFFMVHNAWVVAVGNRHDLAAAAKTMEPFDDAMAEVYADRSGAEKSQSVEWMDKETWFNGSQAVNAGLADGFLSSNTIVEDKEKTNSMAAMKPAMKTEFGLRKSGMSRNESRSLIGDVMQSSAVAMNARQAVADDDELSAALSQLKETLKKR